jgi:hypothetical protein
MGDFLRFLLHETNKSQTNIVFSHNGGRYDNVLMAGKAYELPQIHIKPVAQGNKIFNLVVKRGIYFSKILEILSKTFSSKGH